MSSRISACVLTWQLGIAAVVAVLRYGKDAVG
jgi:hypothetical protein